MTREERKLALYCLKASSDYHSEVCEECTKYSNCDHTGQDDVTETIIKALEQEPKMGRWILLDECANSGYYCSECQKKVVKEGWSNTVKKVKFCPNCGCKMEVKE